MTAAKDSAEVGVASGAPGLTARRARLEERAIVPGEPLAIVPVPAPAQHPNAPPKAPKPKAMLVRASDVPPRRVEWLWPGRVPFAMVTLLDGDPKLGKSTMTLDLVARVTRGDVMPDGGPQVNGGAPSSAIVMMLEDAVDFTIRPRLDAAGANVDRVHIMTGVWENETDPDTQRSPILPADMSVLRRAILETEARLVIIDPLMAYLGGDTDSHKDQDVRRALTPLAKIAEDTGAAIIIVRHLRKTSGPALYRGGGSIGIMASARMALFLARDPADKDARILAVNATNIANDNIPALRWRLVPADNGVARAQWEGVADGVTADMLASAVPEREGSAADLEPRPGQVDLAVDALRRLLAGGPVLGTRVVKEIMADLECSQKTVWRASKKASITKTQMQGKGGRVTGWEWSLPTLPDGHTATED